MGWSGGTEIFDTAVALYLECSNYPTLEQVDTFVLGVYGVLSQGDWDTEGESEFFDMLEQALNTRGESLYGEESYE